MNNETNKQINGIQVDIQIEYKKYLNKKKSKRNICIFKTFISK